MNIISIINYKGGVGKTTLTTNIAGELAYRGNNVLMIDLDPQASLTFSFLKPDEWLRDVSPAKTIKNWFGGSKKTRAASFSDLIISPAVVNNTLKGRGKLDLISSHLELINVDLELATQLGGANLRQTKEQFLKTHRRLLEGINQIPEDEYDYILIDCPPNFNIVTKNAIVASDYILIPAKPDYLSTMGIDYLKKSVDALVEDYNEYKDVVDEDEDEFPEINPKILGVVFTMVQFYGGVPISATRPFIRNTQKLGFPVFKNYFRDSKSLFADAPQYGVPVVLARKGSSLEIVSEIESIVDEFEANLI